MDPITNNKFITTKSASKLFGYSSDYLARLARSGKIVGKRVGNAWLVDNSSLQTFAKAQGSRKVDQALALAKQRASEYRSRYTPLRHVTHIGQEVKTISLHEVAGGGWVGEVRALTVALAVVAFGLWGSTSPLIPAVGGHIAELASLTADNFADTFGAAPAGVVARVAAARVALSTPTEERGTDTNASTVTFDEAVTVISGLRTAMVVAPVTKSEDVVAAPERLARTATTLPDFATIVGTMVDLPHAAIRAEVALVYGLASAGPATARATVALVGNIGDLVAHSVAHSVAGSVVQSRSLAYDTTVGASVALSKAGAKVEDAYLGALGKSALALEQITRVPSVASALAATAAATSPALGAGETVALTTYQTIHGIFNSLTDSLAVFFTPAPTLYVVSSPTSPRPVARPAETRVAVTAPATRITTISGISADFLNQSLDSLRISILGTVATLNQSRIIYSYSNSATQPPFDGGSVGLSLSAPYFAATDRSATSTLAGGLTVAGTVTTLGNISIGGNADITGTLTAGSLSVASISSGGVVQAPYFIATSTTASQFPYASSTALTVSGTGYFGTASTTNLIASGNSLFNNATSTNFFSTTASSTNLFAQNAFFSTLGGSAFSSLTANYLPKWNSGTWVNSLVYDTGTNVGIATTSPSATFAVQGTSYHSGTSFFGGAITATSTLAITGAITSTATAPNTFPYASTTALTATTGYFGTASTTNLTISSIAANRVPYITTSGVVTSGSGLTYDGTTLATGNFTSSGNISLGSATSTNFFSSRLTANTFSAGQTASTTIDSAGNLATAGTFNLTGLATFTSGFLSTASSTITSGLFTASGGASTTNITASGTGYFGSLGGAAFSSLTANYLPKWNSGTWVNSLVYDTGTSVGIGTTSPSSLLSVHGNQYTSGTAFFGGAITATSTLSVTGLASFANASTTMFTNSGNTYLTGLTGSSLIATDANNKLISTSSIAVSNLSLAKGNFLVGNDAGVAQATSSIFISSTGNVGIGTTSPWANLSIQANNGSTNQTLFAIGSSTASATTTLLVVTNTGSVGIGGTNPSATLEVGSPSATTKAATLRLTDNSDGQTIYFANSSSDRFSISQSSTVLKFNSLSTAQAGTGQSFLFTGGTPDTSHQGSLFKLTGTYNNAGQSIDGLLVNITNTSSAATSTLANFQVGGISKFLVDISGNVGIGTTTPGTLLSVHGNQYTSGTAFFGGAITATSTLSVTGLASFANASTTMFTNSGNTYLTGLTGSSLIATDANNKLISTSSIAVSNLSLAKGNFLVGNDAGVAQATSSIFISSTGNVGIGTTSPTTAKLVIGGTSGAQGFDLATNDQYANMRVIANTAAASTPGGDKILYLGYNQASGGAILFFGQGNTPQMSLLGTTGNVGIGSTTPTYKLGVTGTLGVTGVATLGSSLVLGGEGGFNQNGAGIDTVPTAGRSFRVLNAAQSASQFSVAEATGNTLVGGTLGVTGTITAVAINASGGYTQSGTSANTFTGTPTFSNATYSALFTGGPVGIGTASPQQLLHLSSAAGTTIRLDTSNTSSYSAINFREGTTDKAYVEYINSTFSPTNRQNNLELFNTTATGGIGMFTNSLERIRIDSAGNVGIGTTTPTTKLYVEGGELGIGTGGAIRFFNTAPLIYSSGYAYPVKIDGASVLLNTGSGGNVGIGTTSPRATLHIKGGNTNDLILDNDGTQYTEFDFMNNGVTKASQYWDNTNTTFVFSLSSGANKWSFLNGNVGIGTTTPNYKLVLGGSRPISFDSTSSGGGITSQGEAGGWAFGYHAKGMSGTDRGGFGFLGNNDALSYYYIGDSYLAPTMVVKGSSGNVGIGTTTPGGKFVVQGAAGQLATEIGDPGFGANYAGLSVNGGGSLAGGNYSLLGDNLKNLYINRPTTGDMIFREGNSATQLIIKANTGNVGIGTANPSNKLTVVGADNTNVISVKNPADNSIRAAIGLDASDNANFLLTNASGDTKVYLDSSTGNSYITGGNVGIGTTSPQANLHVYTTTSGQPTFRLNSNFAGGNSIDFNPFISGVSNDGFSILQNGTTRMVISSAGNVGIGTTSPSRLLSVSDDGTYSAYFSGRVGIGVSIPSEMLDVYKSSSPVFALRDANSGLRFVPSSGTNYIQSGTDTASSNSKADLTFSSIFGVTRWMTIQGSTGNVGIGTTGPRSKLDVTSGLANISGDTSDVANFTGANQGINNGNLSINTNDAQGADVGGSIALGGLYRAGARDNPTYATIRGAKTNSTDGNYSGYLAFGTRNSGSSVAERMRIDNSGNVGIGTTGPGAKLHVYGGGAIIEQTSATTLLTLRDATYYGDQYLTFAQAAPNYAITAGYGLAINAGAYSNNAAYPLSFSVAGSERMRITNLGNVGIGTTAPGAKFAVASADSGAGFSSVTTWAGYSIFGPNAGSQTGAALGLAYSTTDDAANIIAAAPNSAWKPLRFAGSTFSFLSGGTTQGLYQNSSGNVGIGTTTPDATLSIVRANDSGNILSIGNVGGNVAFDFARNSVTGALSIQGRQSGANNIVLAPTSGNVGIGTTSPATKLEVGGTTNNVTLDGYLNCTGFTTNANGLIACTASDERLKENITPFATSSALAGIDALNPVSFNWRDSSFGTNQQFGLIAQEVQSVFPNLVQVTNATALTPGGTLTVNYMGLVGPMIRSIQELDARTRQILGSGGVLSVVPGVESQCVTGDTRLRRRRKAGVAAGQGVEFDEVEIKDIAAGDEIQSLDEGTGRVVYSRVNALVEMGEQEVYELVTKSGRRIRTTANHPFLARIKGK